MRSDLKIIDTLMRYGLIVSGAISLMTGIIKFAGIHRFLGFMSVDLPAGPLNLAHDWAGAVLFLLAAAYLIRKRLAREPAPVPGRPKLILGISIRSWSLAGLLFLLAAAAWAYFGYSYGGSLSSGDVRRLRAVEISDYQGEKLTSITALPEVSIKGPQHVDIADYSLDIAGLVESPQSLSYDQVLQETHYSKVVDLNCVEGWSAKLLWEGVLVKDLLRKAGVRPEANTVIFYAHDGYSTSLPLKYIEDRDILLAHKMNGVVLPPERGFPFQLVAEQKWGYKWIKWLTRIELSADANHQGTWEKAGYSKNGDLGAPMFER